MAEPFNRVYFPSNYAEIFTVWERHPSAVLYAGGTGLVREQGRQTIALPPVLFSLDKFEELHKISRTERFLEIGAMVKLSRILDLGKIVPAVLLHCLRGIAGPPLRNIATIGGNICFPHRRLDSAAALCALDAQFELRTAQSVRWISAARFFAMPSQGSLNPKYALNKVSHEILTRIRVPFDIWDYSAYQKFDGEKSQSRVAVFLAKTQKNILRDISIIYKTDIIWRDRNSESILIGKALPLSRRITADFIAHWGSVLKREDIDEPSKAEMINFIRTNVYNLSE
jgi:CO/xanthine dehydrogenase FAD-binding subunit